jgi:5-methylcytosine-specific restriction endonuclease McrA
LHRQKNPELTKKAFKIWAEKNPEKIKQYAHNNYLKHKGRYFEHAKKWIKNNPEKRSKIMSFQNAKRRSRMSANGGDGFEKHHWNELLLRFEETCAYCVSAKANSIDHFVPLKMGGKHDYRNIVPACSRCNSTKRENEPRKWISSRFGEERLSKIESLMLR